MKYVIYHVESTRLWNGGYKTEQAAKARLTRAFRDGKLTGSLEDWAVTDSDTYYNSIERFVERVNIMSGKTYTESINTPPHMSPACESYWSM